MALIDQREKGRSEGPKAFRILDLPREIRDQIYSDLLTPNEGVKHQTYHLQPAILRVNKQLHQEASKVLYGATCWIFFTMDFPSGGNQYKRSGFPLIFIQQRVPGSVPFGGKSALQVDMGIARFANMDIRETYIVTPLDAQHIAMTFTTDLGVEEVEFSIHLSDQVQKIRGNQLAVLDCLRNVRGARRANLTGTIPARLGDEIAELMMTPIKHSQELVDRTMEYQARAEHSVALKRFRDAKMVYIQALNYVAWATTDFPKSPAGHLALLVVHHTNELIYKKRHLLLEFVFCCIKQGEVSFTRTILINQILRDANLPDDQMATAYHYYGLSLTVQGASEPAALAFLHAMMLRPGYQAADEEVDALENRVSLVGSTEVIKTEPKLGRFLEQYRHRKVSDPKPSRKEMRHHLRAYTKYDKAGRAYLDGRFRTQYPLNFIFLHEG